MKPIIVVTRADGFYAREVIWNLARANAPPKLVLVGSRAEQLLFNLRSLTRIAGQLGLIEVVRRLRRTRAAPAPASNAPPLADQAAEHGFSIKTYDCINSGSMVVDILEIPDAVVVLAGCGLVDRAVIHAARGGCVNGHPAILPGVRGIDVVEWALIEGVPLGVTAHHAVAKVDSGDVILTASVEPEPTEDWHSYNARLVLRQAAVLAEAAVLVAKGVDRRSPNPHDVGVLRYAAPARVHAQARAKFEARHQPGSR